ncbi:MAG TPA: DUF1003 domain-containing protein [Dongiaceae bacterium]|nr:DUF1003 domain-containing protein [Dongiaceae bacterium]
MVGWIEARDPYPFILLNLTLSFQAVYTAPILMMSQNRQAEFDRRKAEIDDRISIKAELEIEQLHGKIVLLRGQAVMQRLNSAERPGLIVVSCWRRPP